MGIVTILDISGKLTEDSGAEMWGQIRDLAAAGDTRVLLNLARVSHVDSDGLGTMVALFVAMKRVGGALKLINPTRNTRKLLFITALTTLIPSFEDEASAIASFVAA